MLKVNTEFCCSVIVLGISRLPPPHPLPGAETVGLIGLSEKTFDWKHWEMSVERENDHPTGPRQSPAPGVGDSPEPEQVWLTPGSHSSHPEYQIQSSTTPRLSHIKR